MLGPVATPIIFWRLSKYQRPVWRKIGVALALSGTSFLVSTAVGLAGYEGVYRQTQPKAYRRMQQDLRRTPMKQARTVRASRMDENQQNILPTRRLAGNKSSSNASPGPTASRHPSKQLTIEQMLKSLASLGISKSDLPLFCGINSYCLAAHLTNAKQIKSRNVSEISQSLSNAKMDRQSKKLIQLLSARLKEVESENKYIAEANVIATTLVTEQNYRSVLARADKLDSDASSIKLLSSSIRDKVRMRVKDANIVAERERQKERVSACQTAKEILVMEERNRKDFIGLGGGSGGGWLSSMEANEKDKSVEEASNRVQEACRGIY